MENRSNWKSLALAAQLAIVALLLSCASSAEELCLDIGGTGAVAKACGIGGTGNSANKEGIGGTGNTESGVGGTGIVASKGGIGGTGHVQGEGGIGGTGIVGIITGFGSIWVNGLEVQYDSKTAVTDNETATDANELAIGQVVTVNASGNDNELKANKISVVEAVAGEITSVDKINGKLTVLGQVIGMNSKTRIHDQQGKVELQQGEYVKVSGLRLENGEIVASHIEQSKMLTEQSLLGPVTKINGKSFEIYGQPIATGQENEVSVGQEVLVSGSVRNGVLMARQIAPSPVAQLVGASSKVRLQGYLGASKAQGEIKLGNLEIIVSDPMLASKEKLDALNPGELVEVSGHVDSEHRIVAERIEVSRERPEIQVRESLVGQQGREAMEKVEHMDKAERIDRLDRNDILDRPDHPSFSNELHGERYNSEH